MLSFSPFRAVVLAELLLFVCVSPLGAQATATQDKIVLKIHVPQANAQLWINDKPTQATGITRMFDSPPVETGKKFQYTLKAIWQPNNYTTITRTRRVLVQAGQTVEVDLREEDKNEPDKIVVRYVPTPWEVVDAMLKLAEVRPGDVVYDLGCGDGRIVCAAVARHKAKRGIGLDIDPERIKECLETAKELKVEDKVEFRQQDVLEIKDYSDADVVMLYMGEAMNLALRPVLRKTLKPGARIVSHRFTMGDWKPDQTITVSDRNGERYLLHLWKIPNP